MTNTLPPRGLDCRRKLCRCTHTAPCDAGWMELPPLVRPGGLVYQRVAPCPICRPELTWRMGQQIEAESRALT